MEKIISAYDLGNNEEPCNFRIQLPNQCPRCGIAYADAPLISYCIEPKFFTSETRKDIYSLFFCPHCETCFSVCYISDNWTSYGQDYPHAYIAKYYPLPRNTKEFSKNIKKLSPKFIDIYQQAEQAENSGLTEICGIGYRKALEFLVKDYAIKFNPEKADAIRCEPLSFCINLYIDNKKLKALAKASAWLGNDETHYVRKHEDYNLQHLKAFIASTVSYIDSELSYLEATELISNPKQ